MKRLMTTIAVILCLWALPSFAGDEPLWRLSLPSATAPIAPEPVPPFLDTGDHVIIINAEKIKLTGKKLTDKMYRRHTGYPGGLKEVSAEVLMAKNPGKMVREAVIGMLPKSKLGQAMRKKLKVYRGAQHPHLAQRPEKIAVGQ